MLDDHPAPDWFRRALSETPRDGWVEVEGARVHWLEWGDPARNGLVLVHGGAAHAHWWSFSPRSSPASTTWSPST